MSFMKNSGSSEGFITCLQWMRQLGLILERCEDADELRCLSELLNQLSRVAHCAARLKEWTAAGRHGEARSAAALIATYVASLPVPMRWR